MKKTIIGIILFFAQIGLALYYNQTIDLIYVVCIAAITFIYILYKYFSGEYKTTT